MNNETKEKIVTCGAFHFSAEKTAQVLSDDIKEQASIAESIKDADSVERKLYDTGKTRAEYEVMNKLFELARSGDIQAVKEFDRKTKENRLRGI